MLDDSDVDFAILSGPPGGGCLAAAFWLAVVVALIAIVASNHQECSERHCAEGQPKLVAHECLCVERAQP